MSDFDKMAEEIKEHHNQAENLKLQLDEKYIGSEVNLLIREEKRTYFSEESYKIVEIIIDDFSIQALLDNEEWVNLRDFSVKEDA